MGGNNQNLCLHKPYHYGRGVGKMADWTVFKTSSACISDCGRNQQKIYYWDWKPLSVFNRYYTGKNQKDGNHIRRTGQNGASCHCSRLLRKRCGKTAYRDFKKSGIEGFLRNDAGKIQQQDKRYYSEKIFTSRQSAFGWLGNGTYRRWLDYGFKPYKPS